MNSFRRFLELVASELGGTVRSKEEKFVLARPDKEPIVIDPQVDQEQLSRERLAYVEKQAALVLLTPAVLFAAGIENEPRTRNRKTILRVAFGYRLINGRPCFRRYTSYFEPVSNRRGTIRGDDTLFAESSSPIQRNPDLSFIQEHVGKLSRRIADVYDDYLSDPEVDAEVRAIGTRRKSELFELDLLYNRQSQRHLRTYGVNTEKPWEKPPSPAEEFRRKKAIVYQRHAPLVSVEILSVGTVLTPVEGKTGSLRLPFSEQISADRWLGSADLEEA
jgi:hypothetical protein